MVCEASKNFPAEMSLTSPGLAGLESARSPSAMKVHLNLINSEQLEEV